MRQNEPRGGFGPLNAKVMRHSEQHTLRAWTSELGLLCSIIGLTPQLPKEPSLRPWMHPRQRAALRVERQRRVAGGRVPGRRKRHRPGRPCRIFPRGAWGLLQPHTPRVRVSPAARTLLPLGPCVAEAARPPPPRGRRASSPGTGELCAVSDGPRQLRSRIRVASSWPARFPHRTPLSLAASPRAPLMKSLSRGPPPQTLLQGRLA